MNQSVAYRIDFYCAPVLTSNRAMGGIDQTIFSLHKDCKVLDVVVGTVLPFNRVQDRYIRQTVMIQITLHSLSDALGFLAVFTLRFGGDESIHDALVLNY